MDIAFECKYGTSIYDIGRFFTHPVFAPYANRVSVCEEEVDPNSVFGVTYTMNNTKKHMYYKLNGIKYMIYRNQWIVFYDGKLMVMNSNDFQMKFAETPLDNSNNIIGTIFAIYPKRETKKEDKPVAKNYNHQSLQYTPNVTIHHLREFFTKSGIFEFSLFVDDRCDFHVRICIPGSLNGISIKVGEWIVTYNKTLMKYSDQEYKRVFNVVSTAKLDLNISNYDNKNDVKQFTIS